MPEFVLPEEADRCPHCGGVLRDPPDCCRAMVSEHDLESLLSLPEVAELPAGPWYWMCLGGVWGLFAPPGARAVLVAGDDNRLLARGPDGTLAPLDPGHPLAALLAALPEVGAVLREMWRWQAGQQELLPDGLAERLRAAILLMPAQASPGRPHPSALTREARPVPELTTHPVHGFPCRLLDERTEAVVYPLFWGRARVLVGPPGSGAAQLAYDYESAPEALAAVIAWDWPAQREPAGWTRCPGDGRRRPGGDPAQEYVRH